MSARLSEAPARLARFKRGAEEARRIQLRAGEVGLLQIGAGEIGIGEVAGREVEPGEIAEREHRACAADPAGVQQFVPRGGCCDLLCRSAFCSSNGGFYPDP